MASYKALQNLFYMYYLHIICPDLPTKPVHSHPLREDRHRTSESKQVGRGDLGEREGP